MLWLSPAGRGRSSTWVWPSSPVYIRTIMRVLLAAERSSCTKGALRVITDDETSGIHTVQTGHHGGQLVEQAGGRPCQSSTFRFIPLIAITPAGRGRVLRTDSTPPQAKR